MRWILDVKEETAATIPCLNWWKFWISSMRTIFQYGSEKNPLGLNLGRMKFTPFFNNRVHNRWIRWAGPVLWSPRSPVLTPIDVLFLGHGKNVCESRQFLTRFITHEEVLMRFLHLSTPLGWRWLSVWCVQDYQFIIVIFFRGCKPGVRWNTRN